MEWYGWWEGISLGKASGWEGTSAEWLCVVSLARASHTAAPRQVAEPAPAAAVGRVRCAEDTAGLARLCDACSACVRYRPRHARCARAP